MGFEKSFLISLHDFEIQEGLQALQMINSFFDVDRVLVKKRSRRAYFDR
jgi:hypothetical protein